jgi:hypothetical protein
MEDVSLENFYAVYRTARDYGRAAGNLAASGETTRRTGV